MTEPSQPDFPSHCLPPSMREACEDLERQFQPPVGVAGSQVVAAASAACQLHVVGELPTGAVVPVTLGVVTIGPSGSRRSSVMKPVFAPWDKKEAAELVTYQERLKHFSGGMSAWKVERAHHKKELSIALKSGDTAKCDEARQRLMDWELLKPTAPVHRRWMTDNFTLASLFSLAKENPSLLIYSEEGSKILGPLGLECLATLNIAYDNSPIREDRIGRGSTVIAKPRIGLNVAIQTKAFIAFMATRGQKARDIGFFARHLICVCQPRAVPAETLATPLSLLGLDRFTARCSELIDMPIGAELVIRLSPAAREVWVAFANEMETRRALGGDLHDVADAAAKLPNNAARMAAIFEYFEHRGLEISAATMRNAIEICRWYLVQFQATFAEKPRPTVRDDAIELFHFLIKQFAQCVAPTSYTRSVLQSNGPWCLRGAKGKARFDAAVEYLIERGLLIRRLDPVRFETPASYPYLGRDYRNNGRFPTMP